VSNLKNKAHVHKGQYVLVKTKSDRTKIKLPKLFECVNFTLMVILAVNPRIMPTRKCERSP